MKPSIVFAGTPKFAADILKHLIASLYDIRYVYTQPDRGKGRGQTLACSPVADIAEQHRLPLGKYPTINQEAISRLQHIQPDILITAAYGLILPEEFFSIPKFSLNIHTSLLPRWRGAAPIQHAILQGDEKTGVSIMRTEKALDEGDTCAQTNCSITPQDTLASIEDKLLIIAKNLLFQVLQDIDQGKQLLWKKQLSEQATYASKIRTEDGKIDWRDSQKINRQIRALSPKPGAWSCIAGKRFKVIEADVLPRNDDLSNAGTVLDVNDKGIFIATDTNILVITRLQFENKKSMSVKEFLCGGAKIFFPGQSL